MKQFCKQHVTQIVLFVFCLCPFNAAATGAYEKAKLDVQNGRIELAQGALNEIIKKNPDHYQAWFLLGVVNARKQRYHQAIEAFRHVIELKPLLAEPHNNLAVIYNELGDVRAAVKELEQSLEKHPGYAIAEENLADLYVKLALQNYRRALEKEPNQSLERRYMRLLQVRDPVLASPAVSSEKIVMQTPPVSMPENENKKVTKVIEPAGLSQPKQIAKLPKTLPVIHAESDRALVKANDSMTIKAVKKELLQAVEMWRLAWSSRDLAAYFFAYAEDFQIPERFSSFEDWQRYKQRVIGSKTYIQVELSDVQIEIDEDGKRGRVKFFQKFRSNSYNGDDFKVLQMRQDKGVWKIVSEASIS